MVLSLKPQHLKRYTEIARLLLKYGRTEFARPGSLADLSPEVAAEAAPPGGAGPEDLAADLEKMGPTFVKLGQLLSTRGDLLPVRYVEALSRLQDGVAPVPFEEIERRVSSELGVRISKAFSSFDPQPVASASLGQVHRARMRDGREVAVKVQRPEIRERLIEDFDALEEIAEFLDRHTRFERYRLPETLRELRRTLFRELDYRQEARHLAMLRENLAGFDRLVVPRAVDDYTSSAVLTMEFVDGCKITKVDPLRRFELGGAELAEQLFRAYLKQMLVDGFLHADPHPGNLLITPDGRVALLDLGLVAHLDARAQEHLVRLILGISEDRAQDVGAALLDLGRREEHFDREAFDRTVTELVARGRGARIDEIEVGRTLLEMARTSVDCGVRFPPEITVVGQTLLKLDAVGRMLDREFKPNDALRRNVLETLRERAANGFSLGRVLRGAAEVKDFVAQLPGRVNAILDSLARREFEVRVRAIDETRLMEGIQKIANRITLGLILAALIVGAALLMRVETSFRILGYPGVAIVLFLAAALGGASLALNIAWRDRARRPPSAR